MNANGLAARSLHYNQQDLDAKLNMNTLARDPKGYYAVLGLTPGADTSAIKSAYRTRVKSVHPDRNASSRAREEFQRLMEAYAVLRDVVRRAEYDTTGQECLDDDDEVAGPIAIAVDLAEPEAAASSGASDPPAL